MLYNALGISGDPCSGKSSLIKLLAQELGWNVLSIGGLFRKRFEQWKEATSIRTSLENDFDWWWANRVTDADIRSVNTEAAAKLAQGDTLLDSRYISVNAKGLSNVARVFLTAPLEIRATRALASGRYEGLLLCGAGGAMDLLHQRGNEEYRRGKELYGIDYRNPHDYHLVLNTDLLTIDQERAQVLTLLRTPITS